MLTLVAPSAVAGIDNDAQQSVYSEVIYYRRQLAQAVRFMWTLLRSTWRDKYSLVSSCHSPFLAPWGETS